MVIAIIEHESSGQANVSNGNCKGLMQIYEKYHMDRMKKLGVTDLYDPYSNMLVGCDYLAELFRKYEDMGTVLMIYNGTQNAVSRGDAADYTTYALGIMERTYELEEIHGKHKIGQTSVG
jgi:soluble lytic murein transglycosylase-like protein